ncbi:MAG TPA: mycofactocin biosynthesis glycosyltransferase MftF [Solirubrobacter sp.]|nr:mycofactocin biosynthesis glycosyltransferase MftF [Solirubrobacter sp.]
MQCAPEANTPLPEGFTIRIDARREGDLLIGGEPFTIGRIDDPRELVMRNLAQPIPPPCDPPPVTAVIPVRDRPIDRLLDVLDIAEVIVVDDASDDPAPIERAAERAGARYIRRPARGGAGAARNDGLEAATHDLVALLDSDCIPLEGWLDPLLPHFQDPVLSAIAPRIVATDARGIIGRYEARHSPLDRGPHPARVIPHGRVPFVPGAALVVRKHLRFDTTLRGGEDVDLAWRAPYVRYEPASQVAHAHRTTLKAWLGRRVYYGRTAAPLAKRHPGKARPLHVSPWTTAAWAALALKRPRPAIAITATAVALLSRELPPKTAAEVAGLGTLRSGPVFTAALRRFYWPLAPLRPRLFALAALTHPLRLADDIAYGAGVWIGCLEHRTLDPLLPSTGWRLERHTAAQWGASHGSPRDAVPSGS